MRASLWSTSGGKIRAPPTRRSVLAETHGRVKCIGPVYESKILNGLYKHCRSYLHGHEVGGTNPSLLRAMAAGAACIPIDVVFHREVLGGHNPYFTKEAGSLAEIIDTLDANAGEATRLGMEARCRAERLYRWDAVAAAYATLFSDIIVARPSGAGAAPSLEQDVYHPERFLDVGDDS